MNRETIKNAALLSAPVWAIAYMGYVLITRAVS
jgi:hypothetical protein